jgi:hypothetical protein
VRLEIEDGILYADGLHFCRARPGNGRTDFAAGSTEVEVRAAPQFGYEPLAFADGVGYFGGTVQHDIIVGRTISRGLVLPNELDARRVANAVEAALDRGERVTLVIK